MLIKAAEQKFQQGIEAFTSDKTKEALTFFRVALDLEERCEVEQHQARYLSYYGLCLALTLHDPHQAARRSREAATLDRIDPDIQYNLGRVLYILGKRGESYQAFQRGLRLDPTHEGIRRVLDYMGVRRKPALPFLSRQHRLNVLLGRWRSGSRSRATTQQVVGVRAIRELRLLSRSPAMQA